MLWFRQRIYSCSCRNRDDRFDTASCSSQFINTRLWNLSLAVNSVLIDGVWVKKHHLCEYQNVWQTHGTIMQWPTFSNLWDINIININLKDLGAQLVPEEMYVLNCFWLDLKLKKIIYKWDSLNVWIWAPS